MVATFRTGDVELDDEFGLREINGLRRLARRTARPRRGD
jgi:hypothetical protein